LFVSFLVHLKSLEVSKAEERGVFSLRKRGPGFKKTPCLPHSLPPASGSSMFRPRPTYSFNKYVERFRNTPSGKSCLRLDDASFRPCPSRPRHPIAQSGISCKVYAARKLPKPRPPSQSNADHRTALYRPMACWVTSEYGPVETRVVWI